jgi:hypothetical protein
MKEEAAREANPGTCEIEWRAGGALNGLNTSSFSGEILLFLG